MNGGCTAQGSYELVVRCCARGSTNWQLLAVAAIQVRCTRSTRMKLFIATVHYKILEVYTRTKTSFLPVFLLWSIFLEHEMPQAPDHYSSAVVGDYMFF